MAKSRARKFADLLDSSGNIKGDRTNAAKTLSDLEVSATKEELNLLDGVTATTAELNYVDGVTSNIQTQIDGITQATGNELENVSEDTTPQLGGNLDVAGNSIVSASNGDINITPNGTGSVVIDGLSHPQSDGTAGQLLKTDGAGNLSFTDAPSSDLVDDTTPQLGGNLDLNGNNITGTGNIPAANLTGSLPAIDGSALTGVSSVGGDTGVDFNDSVKARFGTGNDLEIYHDGSHSYIKDAGSGDLIIQASDDLLLESTSGENYINCNNDGSVEIFYNGGRKLETAATGVRVAGRVEVDQSSAPTLVLDSTAANDTAMAAYASFQRGGSEKGWIGYGSSGNNHFRIQQGLNGPLILATNNTERLGINGNGSWRSAPSGTVVDVRSYENSTRVVLSTSSHTNMLTFTDTKKLGTGSKIIIHIHVPGWGDWSGSAGTFIEYDGVRSYSAGFTYDNTQHMRLMSGIGVFTGRAAGSRSIKIGWKTASGSTDRIFRTMNPNSSDDSRFYQMKSVVTVYEVIA